MRPAIGEDGPGVGFVFGAYLELQRAKAGLEDAGVFAGEKCLDAGVDRWRGGARSYTGRH